jgi:hypothetical protein
MKHSAVCRLSIIFAATPSGTTSADGENNARGSCCNSCGKCTVISKAENVMGAMGKYYR